VQTREVHPGSPTLSFSQTPPDHGASPQVRGWVKKKEEPNASRSLTKLVAFTEGRGIRPASHPCGVLNAWTLELITRPSVPHRRKRCSPL